MTALTLECMEEVPPQAPIRLCKPQEEADQLDLDYVYHPSFSLPGTEERLFGQGSQQVEVHVWERFAEPDTDSPTIHLRRAVLNNWEQQTLFLQYNYARYRIGRLGQNKSLPKAVVLRQRAVWYERAHKARAGLVHGNMALVLAMAKRAQVPSVDFEDLISEGQMALLRCIDRFNISRGFRFSTYACNAILRSFSRLARKAAAYHRRFPTSYDPELEQAVADPGNDEQDRMDRVVHVRRVLAENRANLTDLEQKIILTRFGLTSGVRGQTLAEIGENVGLSLERVRQILNHALVKLGTTLDGDYVAA